MRTYLIWITGFLASALTGGLVGTALVGLAGDGSGAAMGTAWTIGIFAGAPAGALAFVYFRLLLERKNGE